MVWFKNNEFLAELSMNCIGTKLSKNFAWELGFLYQMRNFSDGITWAHVSIESDWYKGDHNPQFVVQLIVLMIFEFRVYNVHHLEDQKRQNLKENVPECLTKRGLYSEEELKKRQEESDNLKLP